MRAAIPFVTGIMIVSATMLGVAHAVGSDGEITLLMRHGLNGASAWIDELGQAVWETIKSLL